MLEAVARPAPDQPEIACFRMLVDNEVAVRTVRVLTQLDALQRGIGERRKAPSEGVTGQFNVFRAHAAGRRFRLDDVAVRVVCDLETARPCAGYAVPESLAEIRPDRQRRFCVAGFPGGVSK